MCVLGLKSWRHVCERNKDFIAPTTGGDYGEGDLKEGEQEGERWGWGGLGLIYFTFFKRK